MENRQKIAIFCVSVLLLSGIAFCVYNNLIKAPTPMEIVTQKTTETTTEYLSEPSTNANIENTSNNETENNSDLYDESFSDAYFNPIESEVVSL